jgi:O-antigen/teichoic acid export membrane protein
MLIKNTVYNLMGLGLPLLVAIVSIPALIHGLGDSRFGVLTLVWAVVSYFGLFDLGLGRALTQQLSVLLAEKREVDIPSLVCTCMLLLGGLGLLAFAVMYLGAEWGAQKFSSSGSATEVVGAIRAMAFAMPFILLTSGLRGILEAKHAFGVLNLIRLPMGIFTFLGPLAVLRWYGDDLAAITIVLTAGRVVAALVHAYYAGKCLPGLFGPRHCHPGPLKSLLVSGGWMTLSNVVSPLMGYMDRFLIGTIISASAVAYYVTPNEMMTKLWIIPGALTAVLFPRFATNIIGKAAESTRLYKQAIAALFLVLYPITLFIAVYAKEIMQVWINPEFAERSYVLMQVFSFGILVNCVAHVPFTFIQSVGRAKTSALIHVAELPLFAAALWICTVKFGLLGAVFAWLARMLVDTALMAYFAGKIVGTRLMGYYPVRLFVFFAIVLATFFAGANTSGAARVTLFVVSNVVVYAYYWTLFVDKDERSVFIEKISTITRFLRTK